MKRIALLFCLVIIGFQSFAQVDMTNIQNMLQSGGLDQVLQSNGIGADAISKLKSMSSQYGSGAGSSGLNAMTGANSTIVTNSPADSFLNAPHRNANQNNIQSQNPYLNNLYNQNNVNTLSNILNNYASSQSSALSPSMPPSVFFGLIANILRMNDSLKNIPIKRAKSIFGLDYFQNTQLSVFDRSGGSKAPENYLLDEGDELNISLWGNSEYNEVFKIDNEGYIQPQNVGRIYLKGLSFKDARDVITKKFGGVYDLNSSKIGIKLNYSRIIKVNIVGEVTHPGTYSMSAINSAFNALTAAQGIDSIGTVRNIQIKRDGKIVRTLDLYEFLMNPDNKEEYYLRDNDYIIVNFYEAHVSVLGNVKRPMIYEMKKGETINDLMKFSGGLKSSAYTKNIRVKHFENNRINLVDVDYDAIQKSNSKSFALSDGDEVLVSKVDSEIINKVSLIGAVRVPNDYEIKENETRVADVIKKAGGVLYSTYNKRAYLTRIDASLKKMYLTFNVDSVLNFPNISTNYLLKPFDKIEVFSKHRFEDSIKIKVSGAVRIPGQYTFGTNLTLKDVLYYAGGLRPEAAGNRIEVARIINYNETTKQGEATKIAVKTVQVNKDLSIDEVSAKFEMQPYDEVFVRTIPDFDYHKDVILIGEVKYPGTYSLLSKNEKLLDVIKRAGGILPSGFHQGVIIKRTKNKIGNVVVDLDKAMNRPHSQFNYLLRENDTIVIPKINELVTITGSINFRETSSTIEGISHNIADTISQISVPFFAGKRAGYYIKSFAGGFDKDAFRKKVISIEANGRVRSTRRILGFINHFPKVKMGAKIVVPKKSQQALANSQAFDWNRAFDTFTIRITGLVTLFVLASKAADIITNK